MMDETAEAMIRRSGLSRREFLRNGALVVAGAGSLSTFLAACSSSTPTPTKTTTAAVVGAGGMAKLIAGAKREGRLNVIALPADWANYGAIMSTFKSKYGIALTDAAPDDSSAEENQAIISLKGQSRAPDAVDVGPSFAQSGTKQGLYAPFKVSTWDTIPDNMKDPNGYWTADYYGVMSFGTNTNVVKNPPKTWDDLLKPEYKGMVSIDGDPRSAADAFSAVFAAALANGGSVDDISPGIDFFVKVKNAGNFNPTDCYPANIVKGATPIAIKWDYLNLGYKQTWAGNPPYEVSIPTTGVYGGYYCQAVSATAPNPDAARLWEEFLYSDEGQLLYLAGFSHPARYLNLASTGKIPASLAAKLPPASAYASATFATPEQITKAGAVVQAEWGSKMGVA
jgi:putative spermidine/putrescine transport system substrate-binding protein